MTSAFRSVDYRRFWLGSLAANLGLWIHAIAAGWLVYDLTRRAGWLGAVSFIANAPTLLLGLVGGAIVDRTSLRGIMTGALLVLSGAAATLALVTGLGHVTVWHVVAVALVSGTAQALYTPAVHALVPTLIPPDALLAAISLNAVQFNLARAVGPALAGFLYGRIGPQGCFALNATGFLVLAATLTRIRIPTRPAATAPPITHALGEAIAYVRGHAVIAPTLAIAAAMSLFGFPYIILMPALARDTLHLDAAGLGALMACMGGGAVVGGLAVSAASRRRARTELVLVGALAFGTALMGFALTASVRAVAALLVLLGALQTSTVATLTTTVQAAVDDGMRGRVMSMVAVVFFGFSTAGGLVAGLVADRIGVPDVIALGGLVTSAVAGTGLLVRRRAAALAQRGLP